MTSSSMMTSRRRMLITGLLWLLLGIQGDAADDNPSNFKRMTALDLITLISRTNSTPTPCDGTMGHEDCQGTPDGCYQNANTINCSEFYRCEKEKRFNCTCDGEHVFDAASQSCVSGSKSPPCLVGSVLEHSNQCCRTETLGLYIVHGTRCRKYYECLDVDHRRIDHECPANETFDVDSSTCRNSDDVVCAEEEEKQSLDATCKGKYDGKYALQSVRFYVCTDGIKTSEGSCQEGQIFERKLQRCVTTPMDYAVTDACDALPDGYYPNTETYCKTYYYCINGQTLFEKECPADDDTLFDALTKKCRTSAQVSCASKTMMMMTTTVDVVDRCRDAANGYHLVATTSDRQCRRFVACKTGRKTADIACPLKGNKSPITAVAQCPDEGSQQCHDAETQLLTNNDDENCLGKENGRYEPDPRTNCETYYYCKDGVKSAQLSCREGHIFDVVTESCQPRARAECHRRLASLDPCSDKVDGYFADVAKSCRGFYRCKSGRTTNEFGCPKNHAFDEAEHECRTQHEVACDSQRQQNPCEAKREDGFYPNYSTGCRRYYHCRHASKSAEYVCTSGQLFDPVSLQCLPADDVVCSTTGTTKTVVGTRDECGASGQDGYHPNYNNGCKHYYYCRGGIKLAELACPEGKAFDSERVSCVEELLVKCHLRPDDDCHGRFDGLYANVDKGCTSYNVCVNNRLIKTGQCPDGTLFDRRRQSCQPADHVTSCTTSSSSSSDSDPMMMIDAGIHLRFGVECGFNVSVCFDNEDIVRNHCSSTTTKSGSRTLTCKIGGLSEMSVDEDGARRRRPLESPYDCSDKEDGYYTDPDSACRKWHVCEGGQGTTHECDAGNAFNILYRRCDPFDSVDCDNQSWVYRNHSAERSFPTHSTGRQRPTLTNSLCQHSSDGIYADLNHQIGGEDEQSSMVCYGAHLCLGEMAYDITCPLQKVENVRYMPTGRTAVPLLIDDGDVVVSQQRIKPSVIISLPTPDCAKQADGFHVHPSYNCREFHVCRAGRLTSYACIDPLVFEVATKTCRPPPAAAKFVCTTSPDNAGCETSSEDVLHPVDGCRAYFGCRRGRFQHVDCPEGTLFNRRTSKCDSKPEAAILCSANVTFRRTDGDQLIVGGSSFECNAKPDGFYPDYGQKCHVFYRCIRGKKFSHYCKLGQLFNPLLQSCDFEENVQCQVEAVEEPS